MDPVQVINVLAHKLSDPVLVRSQVLAKNNQNPDPFFSAPVWSDFSLSAGFPGIMVFFAELEKAFPDNQWEKVTHQYALAIGETLKKGLPKQYSLFSGVTGICYAFDCACCEGVRYERILDKLHRFLYQGIKDHYLEPLEKNLHARLPSSPFLFDIIMGVAGPLIYLSSCHKKSQSIDLCERIAKTLVHLVKDIKVMGHSVPGWYTSQEDQFLDQDKKKFSKGNFNLGLAHGIPGVLGALVCAWNQGIKVEGQMEAMQTIGDWLISQISTVDSRAFWGDRIAFEEYVAIKPRKHHITRAAWCYGTPGVACLLYHAGKKLGHEHWQKIAKKSYEDVFSLNKEKWHIPSPTFCHGTAGLYTMTHLMAKQSCDPELYKRARELRQDLLSRYSVNHPFGFQDLDPQQKGTLWPRNTPGLLEGAAGIGLALLYDQIHKPQWHRAFAIG